MEVERRIVLIIYICVCVIYIHMYIIQIYKHYSLNNLGTVFRITSSLSSQEKSILFIDFFIEMRWIFTVMKLKIC